MKIYLDGFSSNSKYTCDLIEGCHLTDGQTVVSEDI